VGFTHDHKEWNAAQQKWLDNPQQENDINFRYLATRYALAPVFVERGEDHPFVIACFKDPAAEPKEEDGLHREHDFGDGVKLYRRKGR
jgi:hypothetical protein